MADRTLVTESVMEARALHSRSAQAKSLALALAFRADYVTSVVRAESWQSHHKVVMSINVHRCHLFEVVDRAGWLDTQEVSFPSYYRLYTGRAAGKMGVTLSTKTARWVR